MLTKDKVEFLKLWTEDVVGKKIFYNDGGVSVVFNKNDFIGYVNNCDLLLTCKELNCGVFMLNSDGNPKHCTIKDILYLQNEYNKKSKRGELSEELLYG